MPRYLDFEYSRIDSGIRINNYVGRDSLVNIPEKIDGLPVISIGDWAFSSCSSLTSITITNSVTSIGESAFSWCSSLISMNLPNYITEISDWLFRGCKNLKSVNIPDSVTKIGSLAFMDCQSLTEINIPNSVKQIKEMAFNGCKNLTKITIPDSVNYMGYGIFAGCIRLESINFPSSVKKFFKTDSFVCRKVFSDELWIDSFIGNKSNVFVPFKINARTVTRIGKSAFCNCDTLEYVSISHSVLDIDEMAFRFCRNLKTVVLSSSIECIGSQAFDECHYLSEINLPDTLSEIGRYAFSECASLEYIVIPPSLRNMAERIFCGCTNLKKIYCPISLKYIESVSRNLRGICNETKCKVHFYKMSHDVSAKITEITKFTNVSKAILDWLRDIQFFLMSHKPDIHIDNYAKKILDDIKFLYNLQQNIGKSPINILVVLINSISSKEIKNPEIIQLELKIQKEVEDLKYYEDITLSLFEDEKNLTLF